MKKLLILFLALSPVVVMSQATDAQLKIRIDSIRTATAPKSITPGIVSNNYQYLVDSKVNRAEKITASGTNTYTASAPNSTFSLLVNPQVLVVFTNTNTSTTVTLNVGGSGAKAIKKHGSIALSINEIAAGEPIWLMYDGTNWQWIGSTEASGGTVTSITASSPLTGGTITSSGSIGITDAAADGSTKGAASFTAANFNSASGIIDVDTVNGYYATKYSLGLKQNTLVSGTNIKTVNSNSLLGSGNVAVGDALVANPLSQFASTTSAQLAGVLSNETGTGVVVFSDSPTLVTPALGTPSALILTSATGLPLTSGVTGLLPLANGGTNSDLSATGGTSNYLKQASSGASVTVGTIPASDIASGAALTRTSDTNVTLTLGGSPSTSLLAATSLTLGWTGTLAYSRFVNGAGLSVVGRSANSSGVQSDIAAGSDYNILRRSGTSIGFGGIDLSQSGAVGSSVLGVANGGSGTSTAFTAGSIIFAGASGVYSQNNAGFFWDNSNTIQYIGGNSGAFTNSRLHITGTVNSYIQNNVQNLSNGTAASSDWVATADTGTDATNFIDMGINGSGNTGTTIVDGALNSYLYANGGNLSIGTASAKDIVLFTGGTTAGAANNERMRISSLGAFTLTGNLSSSGTSFGINAGSTLTANTQTMTAYDLSSTFTPGSFTGYNYNILRIRDNIVAQDLYKILRTTAGVSQMWDGGGTFNFQSGTSTSVIRNTMAALMIRGGSSTSTTHLQFGASANTTTNNLSFFNFTDVHFNNTLSASTRTNSGFLIDYEVDVQAAASGSTINHTVFNINPTFSMAASTLNVTALNYNPSITATLGTHYGILIAPTTALNGFGTATPTSNVQIKGSFSTDYIAKTGTYTATISDYFIDCTANSFTVTLPTAVGITGREYIVKNSGTATVITIATTSSQTIDGAAPGTLTTAVPLRIKSDGANWKTF